LDIFKNDIDASIEWKMKLDDKQYKMVLLLNDRNVNDNQPTHRYSFQFEQTKRYKEIRTYTCMFVFVHSRITKKNQKKNKQKKIKITKKTRFYYK